MGEIEISKALMPAEIFTICESRFLKKWAKIESIALQLKDQFFEIGNNEIIVKCRISQLSYRKFHENPIDLDDVLSILQSLALNMQFSAKIHLDLVEFGWVSFDCLKRGFSVHKTSSKVIMGKNDEDQNSSSSNLILALETFVKFLSFNLFTSSNRPDEEFLFNFMNSMVDVVESNPLTVDRDAIYEIEHILMDNGFLVEDYTIHLDMQTTKNHALDLSTLSTVKQILESTDFNASQVSEATELFGLSSLLGRKINQLKFKEGQESVDRNFHLPVFHVSVQAQSVMEIIYSTLDQINSELVDTEQAAIWCRAKSCLDLVRLQEKVIPSDSSCSKSMIRFNDLLYFAHHIATIGTPFKERMGINLREHSLLDLAPFFYELGKECLRNEMQWQLNEIDGFYTGDLVDLDFCNSKCLRHLQSVSKRWKVI